MPEGFDERATTTHAAERAAGMAVELSEIPWAEVRQLVVLQVAPDELGRIHLGGVRRQPLECDAAVLLFDVLPNDAATVSGETIPDDQELSRNVTRKMLQELDHLRSADRSGEEAKVEPPQRDPGDRGQQVPVEVILQHGRLAPWAPRAAPMGPLAQSTLVDEDDRLSLAGSVFFNAGHRWRFHRAMATSSRSSARPVGF